MKLKKLALITGASSGIGYSLAKVLHATGYDVLLVARREDKLKQLSDELNLIRADSATFQTLDLSLTTDLHQLEIIASQQQIDLLVNNVGRGSYGYFEELSRAQEELMVKLNVIAPLRLSHAVIPGMKQRKTGGIIFISSIAAFQPLPYMSTYAATKAFNFSQALSLREELRPFNINVIAICPGPVATEFGGVARVPGTVTAISRDSADMVALQTISALDSNRSFIIPGWKSWLMSLFPRFLPFWFTTRVTGWVIDPKILLK